MRTLVLLFITTGYFYTYGQYKEIEVKSEVKEVIIYLQGAQETRIAKVNLPEGNSTLVFKGLPSHVNPASIQLKGVNEFTILSVNFRQNFLAENKNSAHIQLLTDSLAILKKKLRETEIEKSILNEEKSMFQSNRKLSADDNLDIESLTEIGEIYRERIHKIELNLIELNKKTELLQKDINKYSKTLNALRPEENMANGEVLVSINAKNKISTTVYLSYITNLASWMPFYDIRSNEAEGPVSIIFKANVKQFTGTDWNNVKITLSTANPDLLNNIPDVPVWFVDYYYGNNQFKYLQQKSGYEKNAPPKQTYKKLEEENHKDTKPNAISNVSIPLIEEAANNGNTYSWSPNTSIVNNIVTNEYEIKTPYSIPADAMDYIVEIGKYDFPAQYKYIAIPKINEDAYLIARITGWFEYNLLPAESNIYYKGTYVGKAFLDTETTNDTLEVSMGIDESVVVKRKQTNIQNSRSINGNTRKKNDTFEISLRNNKGNSIIIEIEDQIPISKQKEIVVETGETSKAEYNKDTGKLKWIIDLAPSSTHTIKFDYTVKYPKNYFIPNL